MENEYFHNSQQRAPLHDSKHIPANSENVLRPKLSDLGLTAGKPGVRTVTLSKPGGPKKYADQENPSRAPLREKSANNVLPERLERPEQPTSHKQYSKPTNDIRRPLQLSQSKVTLQHNQLQRQHQVYIQSQQSRQGPSQFRQPQVQASQPQLHSQHQQYNQSGEHQQHDQAAYAQGGALDYGSAAWIKSCKSSMYKCKFYFDLTDPALQAKAVREVTSLNASVTAFFSADITHLVTTKPIPDADTARRFIAQHRAGSQVADGPTSPLARKLQRSTRVEDNIMLKALSFGSKVWSLDKLNYILKPLLGAPSKPSGPLDLQHYLRNEQVYGLSTTQHDESSRSDFHKFKEFYLLVEDTTGKYQPIIAHEFLTSQRRSAKYPWPKVYVHASRRSPFNPPDERREARGKVVSKANLVDGEQEPAPATNQAPKEEPTATQASLLLQRAPLVKQSVNRLNQKTNSALASGIVNSFASAVKSTTSQAGAQLVHIGQKPQERLLEQLGKRVLDTADAMAAATAAITVAAVPTTSVVHKAEFLEPAVAQRPSKDPVLQLEEAMQAPRPQDIPLATEMKNPRRRDRALVVGYCENCKVEYTTSLNDHIASKSHHRYAQDQTKFARLDKLLTVLVRKPRAVPLPEDTESHPVTVSVSTVNEIPLTVTMAKSSQTNDLSATSSDASVEFSLPKTPERKSHATANEESSETRFEKSLIDNGSNGPDHSEDMDEACKTEIVEKPKELGVSEAKLKNVFDTRDQPVSQCASREKLRNRTKFDGSVTMEAEAATVDINKAEGADVLANDIECSDGGISEAKGVKTAANIPTDQRSPLSPNPEVAPSLPSLLRLKADAVPSTQDLTLNTSYTFGQVVSGRAESPGPNDASEMYGHPIGTDATLPDEKFLASNSDSHDVDRSCRIQLVLSETPTEASVEYSNADAGLNSGAIFREDCSEHDVDEADESISMVKSPSAGRGLFPQLNGPMAKSSSGSAISNRRFSASPLTSRTITRSPLLEAGSHYQLFQSSAAAGQNSFKRKLEQIAVQDRSSGYHVHGVSHFVSIGTEGTRLSSSSSNIYSTTMRKEKVSTPKTDGSHSLENIDGNIRSRVREHDMVVLGASSNGGSRDSTQAFMPTTPTPNARTSSKTPSHFGPTSPTSPIVRDSTSSPQMSYSEQFSPPNSPSTRAKRTKIEFPVMSRAEQERERCYHHYHGNKLPETAGSRKVRRSPSMEAESQEYGEGFVVYMD